MRNIEYLSEIFNSLKIRKKMVKKINIEINSKKMKLPIPKNFRPKAWKTIEPKGIIKKLLSEIIGEKVLLKFKSIKDLM